MRTTCFSFCALSALSIIIAQNLRDATATQPSEKIDLSAQTNTSNPSSSDTTKGEPRTAEISLEESPSRLSLRGRHSSRDGRMLDLDHLVGDLKKEDKTARDRKLGGFRQSRAFSPELANDEGRSKPTRIGKKMTVKGFIPIVSLDGPKDGRQLEDSIDSLLNDGDDAGQLNGEGSAQFQQALTAAHANQQTSIGHASFSAQNPASEQTGQHQMGDEMQQTSQHLNRRATRRLLGSHGFLAGPRRLVSTLVSAPQAQHPNQLVAQLQPQEASNIPLAQQLNQMNQEQADCVCVPFFQCINGFLADARPNRGKQHFAGAQAAAMGLGANQYQVPRAIQPADSLHNDHLTAHQSLSSQLELPLAQPSGAISETKGARQAYEQQIVNDIYEQLRKNIEGQGVEQTRYPLQIDERSKSSSRTESGSANETGQLESETEGRSLLNPLARRTGSQQRCGIMRVCCRIPPAQFNQQHLLPLREQNNLQVSHPLQYQTFQPTNTANSQFLGQLNQNGPNQMLLAQSSLSPTLQHQATRPPALDSYPSQGSGFMVGRCGIRQTIGIAGRVQNLQPAPGSESSAEFGEFPSHVAILKRLSPGDSLFVCSAVLISNQWLATAAHCVRKLRPEELKVRLGEWDVNRDDEFYPFVESNIRQIVIHPDFQASSLANDLALLRMEATMDPQQMPHIAPACLANPDESFAGERCWLAGWGKDAFGQRGSFQTQLKKVDLPVVGRPECENALRLNTKLGKFFRLHPSAICAGGERGKDACEGDGGSGLYCTDPNSGLSRVVGLVSWGIGCGQGGVPGVYTSLAALAPWLESVVAASGEENLYAGQADSLFKSLVSERTSLAGAQNATAGSKELEAGRPAQQEGRTSEEPAPSSKGEGGAEAEAEAESRAG